tara:strand:- start:557 stop:1000 length:444 start_codon:yes stop_codon:yes gene_type:complete
LHHLVEQLQLSLDLTCYVPSKLLNATCHPRLIAIRENATPFDGGEYLMGHAAQCGAYRETTRFACSVPRRISPSRSSDLAGDGCLISKQPKMSTEIRNWDVVAKAMEAAGATSSEMYIRAKALALGKLDPMPTSSPEAPYSISAVAG